MKTHLIPFLFLIVLAASCSKTPIHPNSDSNTDANGNYLLSFRIDGFSQELLPFSEIIPGRSIQASANKNPIVPHPGNLQANGGSGTNIRDFINTLEIKVFRQSTLLDSIRQYADDQDFGKYEKYFPPGNNYNVFVVGAMLENNGDIELKDGGPMKEVSETNLRITPHPSDAFFYMKTYQLTKETQQENIQLKRFVGRVEVSLDEPIPENASRIEISIENTAQYFLPTSQRGYHSSPNPLNDNTAYRTVKLIPILPEDIGRENFTFTAYYFLKTVLGSPAESSKVILKAYGAGAQPIQEREIPNVLLQANKRTLLKGLLFTNHPNADFNMQIESNWDPDIAEYEF